MSDRRYLAVIGSLNVDYFSQLRNLPKPGETVAALDFVIRFGGKGANQAIAAVRQGVPVSFLGCVGDDEMGAAYLKRLAGEGIDISGILSTNEPTGSAFISIDQKGENTIVVAAGANGKLTADAIRERAEVIANAAMLLIQFETPLPAARQALEIAIATNVPVALNPSPLVPGFPWDEFPIDYLIVNETEAAHIDALLADNEELRVRNLIITQGASPTLVMGENGEFEVPPLPVTPADSVGAGDAFAGTLAARLVQGETLPEAVRHANIAGALTTLEVGAQEAIPTNVQVDSHGPESFQA